MYCRTMRGQLAVSCVYDREATETQGFQQQGEGALTKPRDQKVVQYKTSQACSANRVTSFFLLMPIYLANGARPYSIVAARRPVRRTTTKATK